MQLVEIKTSLDCFKFLKRKDKELQRGLFMAFLSYSAKVVLPNGAKNVFKIRRRWKHKKSTQTRKKHLLFQPLIL
jgi:hypothetical protein